MSAPLLRRVVVPVATEDDARVTCDAIRSHVDEDATLHVIHVIEKAGGAPDKAPLEARQEQARQIFETVEDALAGTGYEFTTELRYATSVVDEIVAVAGERNATGIAFIPRPSGRIVRLLTGDRTRKLVSASRIPVVVLPREEETA